MRLMFISTSFFGRNEQTHAMEHKSKIHHGYRIDTTFAVYFNQDNTDYLHNNKWCVVHISTGYCVLTAKTRKDAVNALTHFDYAWFDGIHTDKHGYLVWPNLENRVKARDTWQDLINNGLILP